MISRIAVALAALAVGSGAACSGAGATGSAATGSGGAATGSAASTGDGTASGAVTGSAAATSSGAGAGGGAPACASGDAAALASTGDDTPDGTGTPESVITIANVGGTGTYPRVTNMNPGTFGQPCPTDACVKQATPVSGPLAPFDEEMTLNLRGPLELYDLAVYEPSAGSFQRVGLWNRCGSDNVTFVNNMGGGKSGVWTSCGGNSQSYASADGKDSAAGPTPFSGSLDNGVEVNVLSAAACKGQDDASECGFSRGVALHGLGAQPAKIFAMRARMPRYTGPPGKSYTDQPAIWMLNARIVRTAQYGCNCRGVGSPGGCGELDVAEVVGTSHLTHATSTVYSFQGAIGADGASGAGHYFVRPVNRSAIFVVIFDASGKIQMLRLAPDAFDFGAAVTAATVAQWSVMTGFTMSLP